MAVATAPGLWGRGDECKTLSAAVDRARDGESTVLVVRGEAGIGKTALLQYCAARAGGCRVAQIAGVEQEMELAFAALHQLCAPMLANLANVPGPQADALQGAFGLTAGPPPDRFLVALSVLSLLADVATERPLICLIDDAQWLDEASRQVLGFVARRLLAESVVLLFGVREHGRDRLLPALPDLTLSGLPEADAQAMLAAITPGPLDDLVRDRIVAETRGNPLGLLELTRTMSRAELAGGFGGTTETTVSGQLQEHYRRRIAKLPEPTRRLLVLAAADPTGDTALLWRAADASGIRRDAAGPAEVDQLLTIQPRVQFRHPLIRSAAQATATPQERRAAHAALAAATDPDRDPERRVWHRAAAATEPVEEIARELEHNAGRARARGGLAAAAAFLQRSVALTADPRLRADRALNAALAHLDAGALSAALCILTDAEVAADDDHQRARAEYLRGQVAWVYNPGRDAPERLLQSATRLASLDVGLARQSYLDAWFASFLVASIDGPGGLQEISRAATSVTGTAAQPDANDVLLDGLTTFVNDGLAKAAPTLRTAVDTFVAGRSLPTDIWLRGGAPAAAAAVALGDVESWTAISARQVEVARAAGALTPLWLALNGHATAVARTGDLETAAALVAQERALKEVMGSRSPSLGGLTLRAYRGGESDATRLLSPEAQIAARSGEGLWCRVITWGSAVLLNGRRRHAEAVVVAEPAVQRAGTIFTEWVLPELVEAGVRTGRIDLAHEAAARLSESNITCSAWTAGLDARCRALLSTGSAAEDCYREALELLSRTPVRTDLARAHLLYGEWLRRENRRLDARAQLRTAFDTFDAMGARGFAELARLELLATGEQARRQTPETSNDLTPQEAHIARLAREGRTNSEIGAELFISARTVEWHLRKVFMKLGIRGRRELAGALSTRGS